MSTMARAGSLVIGLTLIVLAGLLRFAGSSRSSGSSSAVSPWSSACCRFPSPASAASSAARCSRPRAGSWPPPGARWTYARWRRPAPPRGRRPPPAPRRGLGNDRSATRHPRRGRRTRLAGPPRGRHAGPRTSALTRLRLPVGRALALTALPTALILGSQRVPAADTSAIAAHSASEVDEAAGADCDRPEDAPTSATEVPASPAPSADPGTSGAHSGADSAGGSDRPSEPTADPSPSLSPAPAATPSADATSAPTRRAGILAPLGLLDDGAEQQSPDLHASPSPSSVTPTPEATAPSDPLLPTTPAPPAGHRAAEPSLPPESTSGTARGAARPCATSRPPRRRVPAASPPSRGR
ncbi:hypothetical protein QFZ32_002451 [Streptomyces canus]|nr:hypothetical protein [Streptomyces canus]